MATILGIESTCDETAAAVVVDGTLVHSNVVATQAALHAKYRGVVPEIACRAHIENILPVLREALQIAGVTLAEIDAVAVAHRPGLIGSLLIGLTAAKTLAWATGKPLIGVDHVHAHLYSVVLRKLDESANRRIGESANGGAVADSPARRFADSSSLSPFSAIGLVCSGGHTALYRVGGWEDVELIGSTLDDAVGEAYDKVAAILGLGYPGGPILDRLAAEGDPAAVQFPRSLLEKDSLDFSFSGLKTSVLYHVRGHKGRERGPESLSAQQVRDVAASFQAACIDVLVKKLRRAIQQHDVRCILIGGGVSANKGLRAALATFDVPVLFPDWDYCTDNAAMSAGLAEVYWRAGKFRPLNLDAIPQSRFRD